MNLLKELKELVCDEKLTCEVCGREIFEGYICEDCKKVVPKNDKNICLHCGRHTNINYEYCVECKKDNLCFDKARSAFIYEKNVVNLIYNFKFNNKKYLKEMFAEYMYTFVEKDFADTDYIIYVPMFCDDEIKRGYNQTKLLADLISEKTNIPVLDNVIKKVLKTENQKVLTKTERKENLKKAFRISRRKVIENKNLLLIDDILTTGSTCDIISAKLFNFGARRVYVLTIASVQLSVKK